MVEGGVRGGRDYLPQGVCAGGGRPEGSSDGGGDGGKRAEGGREGSGCCEESPGRAGGEAAAKATRTRPRGGDGQRSPGGGSTVLFFFFFFRFERFLIPTLVRSQSATADWLPLPVSRRAGEIPREERRADRGARALRVRLADKAELRVWGSAVLRGCEVMRAEIPFPS